MVCSVPGTMLRTNAWGLLGRLGVVFCEVVSNLLSDLAGTEVVSSPREPDPHWGCCLTQAQSDYVSSGQFHKHLASGLPSHWGRSWGNWGPWFGWESLSSKCERVCFIFAPDPGKKSESSFHLSDKWPRVKLCKEGALSKISHGLDHLIWLICLEFGSKEHWKWRGKSKVPKRRLYSKIQNKELRKIIFVMASGGSHLLRAFCGIISF